uniref:Uncharacterized protein n=1 Tax=Caenorhabditis japonica TaxID=281687 RepID=A0A8R1ET98_CAEJA
MIDHHGSGYKPNYFKWNGTEIWMWQILEEEEEHDGTEQIWFYQSRFKVIEGPVVVVKLHACRCRQPPTESTVTTKQIVDVGMYSRRNQWQELLMGYCR